MSSPTLAPTYNHPGVSGVSLDDPFATPTLAPTRLPTVPRPVAQRSPRPNEQYHFDPRSISRGPHNDQESDWHKTGSMSSEGGSSAMTKISSIDLEKSRHSAGQPLPKTTNNTSRDPEKTCSSPGYGTPQHSRRQSTAQVAYVQEDDDFEDVTRLQEEMAVKILLFLAGPCVGLSFLNAIWMLLSLIITILTQPVRICARRPSFSQQLSGLAGPALNLQLKCIYTPLPPHADEDTTYRAGTLVMVQLLTPFASLAMMFVAWVVAVFCLASAAVGDPAGMDKRDDTKETILALRNWWESWLVRCIRED